MQTTQLDTNQLGATGMRITRVGFGACAIGGGGWAFGRGPHEDTLSLEAIERAHASLERLGIDAIDLYQIHWPNPEQDIEEGWAAFAELKEQGLVRHIGALTSTSHS